MDLSSLRLVPGEVRHERPRVPVEPLSIGGQTYVVTPHELEPRLELQAATGGLYLKLAFRVRIDGPCFRCLEPATLELNVRASEYHSSDSAEADDELLSDYIQGDQLDVERWVRDSLVFALPDKILDRDDCAGLCPHCGQRLEPDVLHECGSEELDSRWAKLRDLL
jgi:uncharacterized protein